MRNKLIYLCSMKIHVLGLKNSWKAFFCLLLVVEAFSLQKVVKMLEEVVVCQVNIVDEAKMKHF